MITRYEIDFVNSEEDEKDCSAICMRYWEDSASDSDFTTIIYDGGSKSSGEKLCSHMRKHYFSGATPKVDYLICSHADGDHTAGVLIILEQCKVECICMNRPWSYIDDLWPYVNDGRMTKESLEKRLRESRKVLNEIEVEASKRRIPIFTAFADDNVLPGCCSILSPRKDFYLALISESCDYMENITSQNYMGKNASRDKTQLETWEEDGLRENIETSPENETSVVVRIDGGKSPILLTGDAGVRALKQASINGSLTDARVYQVPHHGSRHNVSPSIMNKLVGPILEKGKEAKKCAYACTADGSDHPKDMVVNAFIRRGCNVYATNGSIFLHSYGNVPKREGWVSLTPMKFSELVEPWED